VPRDAFALLIPSVSHLLGTRQIRKTRKAVLTILRNGIPRTAVTILRNDILRPLLQ
jgi:hypothetical protein